MQHIPKLLPFLLSFNAAEIILTVLIQYTVYTSLPADSPPVLFQMFSQTLRFSSRWFRFACAGNSTSGLRNPFNGSRNPFGKPRNPFDCPRNCFGGPENPASRPQNRAVNPKNSVGNPKNYFTGENLSAPTLHIGHTKSSGSVSPS